MLKGDNGGFAVDRYTIACKPLQELIDGRDEEYVVCALLMILEIF